MAILGMVALIALSRGVRATIHETMGRVEGLVVLQERVPSPVLSTLPASVGEEIAEVEGVRTVLPEIFHAALSLEGEPVLARGPAATFLILGSDPARRDRLRAEGGIFARALEEGELPREPGEVTISRECADIYGKEIGSALQVLDHSLRVVGIFETGSPVFDRQLLVPIRTARAISGKAEDRVSVFYVEPEDPAAVDDLAPRIEEAVPGIRVMTASGYAEVLSGLVADLEPLLWGISMIAVLVGTIGILNTMLMNVTERIPEFGVLRATGWTRGEVVRLVLWESAILGTLGGIVGSAGGMLLVRLAGGLVPIRPQTPLSVVAVAFGLSILLGMAGGIWPAIRAGRLDPIAALRRG